MTNEVYVSIETAKLLAEAGYPQEATPVTSICYDRPGGNVYAGSEPCRCLVVPTQSAALRWFGRKGLLVSGGGEKGIQMACKHIIKNHG